MKNNNKPLYSNQNQEEGYLNQETWDSQQVAQFFTSPIQNLNPNQTQNPQGKLTTITLTGTSARDLHLTSAMQKPQTKQSVNNKKKDAPFQPSASLNKYNKGRDGYDPQKSFERSNKQILEKLDSENSETMLLACLSYFRKTPSRIAKSTETSIIKANTGETKDKILVFLHNVYIELNLIQDAITQNFPNNLRAYITDNEYENIRKALSNFKYNIEHNEEFISNKNLKSTTKEQIKSILELLLDDGYLEFGKILYQRIQKIPNSPIELTIKDFQTMGLTEISSCVLAELENYSDYIKDIKKLEQEKIIPISI